MVLLDRIRCGWRAASALAFLAVTSCGGGGAGIADVVDALQECAVHVGADGAGGTATLTVGTTIGLCGRSVTISAVSSAGYVFDRWSDNSKTNPYTIVVTEAQTLMASFVPIAPGATCTVTVLAEAGGTALVTSGGATGDCDRQVTVQASASAGYRFGRWNDGATDNPRTFTVGSSRTISASFVAQCTLTLAAGSGGSVALTVGTAGGDCGRSITVSATPSNGFSFSSWSDGATQNPYTFVLTASRSLSASFASTPATCTLTVTAETGGTASITSGGATGACGRSVTVSASASSGYRFAAWSDANTQNPRTFVLNSSQALAATFVQQCTLTLASSAGGTASLTAGTLAGDCGRSVTAQAAPNSGFSFQSWSDGSVQNPHTFNVTSTATLTATFTPIPPPCTLTIVAETGGSAAIVSGGATGACGRSITVSATASSGYRFGGWSDGATQSPYTFTLTSTRTLSASFVQQCTLTVSAGPGGSATLIGGTTSAGDCGRSVAVQATPSNGFVFASWSDGSTANPHTFSLLSTRTITATFTALCTLTLGTSTGGSASVTNGVATGACGRSVTVQATPNSGYRFGSWSNGATNNPYTFAIASNTTLTPSFVRQCTLTVTTGTGGTASQTAGTATGDCGRSVTVQANAATGFTFGSWTEGTATASTSATYTFDLAADRTLRANFIGIPCTMSISSSGNSVTVSREQNGKRYRYTGTIQLLNLSPACSMAWDSRSDENWLDVTPNRGTTPALGSTTLTINVDLDNIHKDRTYVATLTFTSTGTLGSPKTYTFTLRVTE